MYCVLENPSKKYEKYQVFYSVSCLWSQCPISKLYSCQTQSRNPTRMNSISNFTSRFSFQSAQMIHTENSSLAQGSFLQILFSQSEDSLAHREYIRFNINITHTRSGLQSLSFLSKKLRQHLLSEPYSCLFSLKILIRLSHMNRTEFRYALSESTTNLFLKRTKYDANNYQGKYFCRKQDTQILVGRRRPSGTPIPTRPCTFHVSTTAAILSFYLTINYRIAIKMFGLLTYPRINKIQNSVECSHGFS
jgi:hypothetical protein